MQRLLYVIVSLLMIHCVHAQNGIFTGRVLTVDGLPAPAVYLQIKEIQQGELSNENGFFSFTVPEGKYNIIYNEDVLTTVSIKAGERQRLQDLQIKLSLKELPEVIVTGQNGVQSLKNTVYKVRVIDQERIKMRAANDVLGVLNNELGVRFSTDYTLGETDVQLMGMGGQRVKVLLDGVPMADRDATKQSLTQVDINNIERIELVEGPMSVQYGTDGLGGVINIITKKGKLNSLQVSARILEESVGNKYVFLTDKGVHNQYMGVNYNKKGFNAGVNATRNIFGGFAEPGNQFPFMSARPKEQYLINTTLGYQKDLFSINYRLDLADEKITAADPMNINNARGRIQHFLTNRLNHNLQSNWQLGSLKFNSSLSYQNYKRATETFVKDYSTNHIEASFPDAASWDVTKFNTLFFRTTTQWDISPKIMLNPGVEVKHDVTSGGRILDGEQNITDYAFFVSGEYKPFNWLQIRPGARMSKNSVYDAPPVIPSINTKFNLNKNWDIRASYARGFRAPILRELYFDFVDANHAIKGNPNLKAEYSNSFIGSISYTNNKTGAGTAAIQSSLSGFYNTFSNFIDMAVDMGTNVSTYFNLDEYKTIGSTFENRVNINNFNGTLGISYIGRYNRYTLEDKSTPELTWSPELTSNLTYTIPKWGASIGFYYKFNGAFPRYTVAPNGDIYLAKISAFHWGDLTISKDLFKTLRLQTGVKNLFDVKRVQNTVQGGGAHSTSGPILNGYGRSVFVGLNFNFTK